MAQQSNPEPARLARVTSALAIADAGVHQSLCAATADLVQVTGAGLVLIMRGRTLGVVCSSNAVTERVEDLQYSLGEGPCVDAFGSRAPVLVPDLAREGLTRWPAFGEGALAAGVRAAFGFPILVGSACIGALNLYQDTPGRLTDEQIADALVVAQVAGRTVVEWQSAADSGSLAHQLQHLPERRAVVHQASGMVSVQAAVAIADAIALLRAVAFSTDRPIGEVAADVVRGVLRFD